MRAALVLAALAGSAWAQAPLGLPSLPAATKPAFGAVTRAKLPNGVSLALASRKGTGVVDVVAAVHAGELAAPVGKGGVADFVAEMLRHGTKTRTRAQIVAAVDAVGAAVESNATDDGTFVACHARARDLAFCVDLVADLLQRPSFPEADLAEVAGQLRAGVEAAKDDPSQLVEMHAVNVYFGDDDARGRAASVRSIGAVNRAALTRFYETWYAPGNTLLGISGDAEVKAMQSAASRAFSGWHARAVPPAPRPSTPAPTASLKIRIVDLPAATQATIAVAGAGVSRAAPDYFATELVAYTLGGGVASRLHTAVRAESGKTSSGRFHFDATRLAGPFVAATYASTAKAGATLAAVLNQLEAMRNDGPTADELAAAKAHLRGAFGLRHETGDDVARALLDAELDGVDPAFVAETPQRIDAVTLADAKAAAAAHLTPALVVIAGRADEIKSQLARLKLSDGAVEVVPYTEPVSAVDRAAARVDRQGTATAEQIAAGEKLLAAALAAKGPIAKAPGFVTRGHGTLGTMGQTVPVKFSGFYLGGKAVREDLQIGPRTVSQVLPPDGAPFVRQGSAAATNLPPSAADAMRRAAVRDPNYVLVAATRGRVRAEPPVTDGGASFDVITVVVDGEPTTLWLDGKSHLPVRLVYTEGGRAVRDELSDYRPVSGVLVPFHVVGRRGSESIDLSYDSITLAAPAADIFRR